jgi:type I restriction enzyme M protein
LGRIIRNHEREQAEAAKKENKRLAADRKTRALKTALEELQAGIKDAESFFKHIHWLQERFPEAEYEDVTGLCKMATIEEIKEQDYSLNPGRYVGVVIEEDGKTEEEFIEELLGMNDELQNLDDEANILNRIISINIRRLVGEI